jgi:hypothetical protein
MGGIPSLTHPHNIDRHQGAWEFEKGCMMAFNDSYFLPPLNEKKYYFSFSRLGD